VQRWPRAPAGSSHVSREWLEAVHGYLPANWDVLWSLSIEEMFYLFFPLACVVLLKWRRGMGAVSLLLLLFVAAGPFARTVWSTNEICRARPYLGGMSGIALGCLTALITDRFDAPGQCGRVDDCCWQSKSRRSADAV